MKQITCICLIMTFFISLRMHALTIEQAVAAAMENRPTLHALTSATDAASMNARSQIADYFPKIALSSYSTIAQGSKQLANLTTLSVEQLIFSASGPLERYRQAKKQVALLKAQTDEAKNLIRYNVEVAFLQTWLEENQESSIRALRQSSQELYAKALHEKEVDLINKSDFLGQKSTRAQAQGIIDTYHEARIISRHKLMFLMGKKIDQTPLSWHPSLSITKKLSEYYAIACKNRPELKIIYERIGIEKDNERIAQGALMPTFSIAAQTGYEKGALISPSGPTMDGFARFQAVVTWPLFDGSVSFFKEKEAHASMLKEIFNQQEERNLICQEVHQAYHQLRQALITLQTSKAVFVKSKNDFILDKQRFEIGDISRIEFSQTRTAYLNAKLDYLSTYVQTAIKERGLALSCGYPQA